MSTYRWPWNQPQRIQQYSDFLRDQICEVFLVKAFKKITKCIYDDKKYIFTCDDETTFTVRASCFGSTSRSWICNLGNITTDFVLFFGLRNNENPVIEFCLFLPLEKFRGVKKISIVDDKYHIKGYSEFSVDDDTLDEMQEIMGAINNHDTEFLQKYLK
jgi:hypothetical protein